MFDSLLELSKTWLYQAFNVVFDLVAKTENRMYVDPDFAKILQEYEQSSREFAEMPE